MTVCAHRYAKPAQDDEFLSILFYPWGNCINGGGYPWPSLHKSCFYQSPKTHIMATNGSRQGSPEASSNALCLDEFKNKNSWNLSQKNLEEAAFTEEENEIRAEVNILLHHRLQLLRRKRGNVALQRRKDHRKRMKEHFENAAQYMVRRLTHLFG